MKWAETSFGNLMYHGIIICKEGEKFRLRVIKDDIIIVYGPYDTLKETKEIARRFFFNKG